jgi:hypothetical protein
MGPAAPTDDVTRLAAAAHASKAIASLLRWSGASAIGFSLLLLVALVLASIERSGNDAPAETSAAAYLDFDLAVLRISAEQDFAGGDHDRLAALWAARPPWRLPEPPAAATRLVSPRDAWSAVASDRSHFRTAAKGVAAALPFLIGGLALAFAGAAAGAILARHRGRALFTAAASILIVAPLWQLVDAANFYDRTRSLGLSAGAILFVASFAGTFSGAAGRALFAPLHFRGAAGYRATAAEARIAAVDAVAFILPLVPALAAAALFVCAKADQDARADGAANGLGILIRAALRDTALPDRLSSCILVTAAFGLLWYAGHRFVLEVRDALCARRFSP